MQRRGFSLVETLVTSAILAVIAGAVAGVMSVAVRASGVEDPKRHDELLSAIISEVIASAGEVRALGPGASRFSVADR
ncbi:MAG: type II secretion system protein, partial [bacterium]